MKTSSAHVTTPGDIWFFFDDYFILYLNISSSCYHWYDSSQMVEREPDQWETQEGGCLGDLDCCWSPCASIFLLLHLMYPVLLLKFVMASRRLRLGQMLSGEAACWQATHMPSSDSIRVVLMPEKTKAKLRLMTFFWMFKTQEELTVVTETVSTAGYDHRIHHQPCADDTHQFNWDSWHNFRL